MKYIKINKSKFIKFFIVILVCVFGFFGVNAVVNADMIWESSEDSYAYLWQSKSHFNWDSFYFYSELGTTSVVGGNDTYVFDLETYNSNYVYKDAWYMRNSYLSSDSYFIVERNLTLDLSRSNDNLLVYKTTIQQIALADYFIFEKNDFFMRLNDLYSFRVPYAVFPVDTEFSWEMEGFIVDKNGTTHEIVLRNNTRNVSQGTLTGFYPSQYEIFGNVQISDLYNSNAIMYISNYRVRIDFPDNHSMYECDYYYGIQSGEDYNYRYGTIFTDYINLTTDLNVGDFLLDSVNSFLQFEILPNFTLFNLFVLIVAIPLLIWVLKLILGG